MHGGSKSLVQLLLMFYCIMHITFSLRKKMVVIKQNPNLIGENCSLLLVF